MTQFKVKKEDLVQLVDRCQNRSFAEEIELLQQSSSDPNGWLLTGTS